MEFRILGSLEVVDQGRGVKLGGAKQRSLLAFLLLNPNRAISRDRLIDELWGDQPPDTAATAIQVHVSQLRKALGRDVIVTQTPGYLIRVHDGELDLERFERSVTEAQSAPPEEASVLLKEALGLWRGTPLAELDAPFARTAGARLDEQRLAALEQRIDADLALGRRAQLVPELEGLVREQPLRERLRGQLMLALYRCGRQAHALDVYRSGRRLLDEELGLEPDDELQRLESHPQPRSFARVARAPCRRSTVCRAACPSVVAYRAAGSSRLGRCDRRAELPSRGPRARGPKACRPRDRARVGVGRQHR
jgi:DNA-binding SARP family transcriptional activator